MSVRNWFIGAIVKQGKWVIYSFNSIQADLVLPPRGGLSHWKRVMSFVCVESSTFLWTCPMYETFVLCSWFWIFLFCFQGMLVEWGDISQCDWLAVQKREFYPRWDPNLALGSQTLISRRPQFTCQKMCFLPRPLFESTRCTSISLRPFTYPAARHYTGNFIRLAFIGMRATSDIKTNFKNHVWHEKEQQIWRELSIRLYIPLSRSCIKWRQSHFASRLWKESEFQGSF